MLQKTVRSTVLKSFCVLVFSLSLFGCGDSTIRDDSGTGGTTGTTTPPTLSSIAVTPANPSLSVNVLQQFTATGTYSDGSTQNITPAVTWSSGTPTVATIDTTGRAQTITPGTTVISAASGSISSPGVILTVTPATLSSISIAPLNSTISDVGQTKQFAATGHYSDATQQDLTTSVTWTTSDASIASISNSSGSQGLATAVAIGSVSISASSGSVVSPSTTLTVAAPAIDHITITTPFGTIAKNYSAQFTATAFFAGSSQPPKDVTASTTFTSGTPTVVTISNDPATPGLAHGVAAGSSTIVGTYQGKTASSGLVVNNDTLDTITIFPSTATNVPLAAGLFQQFSARGSFVNASGAGITQDITNDVQWQAVDTVPATNQVGPVAQVNNTNSSVTSRKGLVFANTSSGKSTITASVTTTTTTLVTTTSPAPGLGGLLGQTVTTTTPTTTTSTIKNTSVLTVAPATVTQLQISPLSASIPAGATKQYSAVAVFSDASSKDVSDTVAWSTDSSAATINSHGLAAAGSAAGSTNIKATVPAAAATSTLAAQPLVVSAPSALTVTSATLSAIYTSLPTPSSGTPITQIAAATTQQVYAVGVYSNGTVQDLTNVVNWTSSTPGTASVSNAAGTKGLVKGLGFGSAIISATDPSTGVHSINTTPNLAVSLETITSIAVTPATIPSALAVGTSQQFKAVGTFTDGTKQDLTSNNVTWASSSAGNVSISNGGLATAVAPTSASISAAFAGVTSNAVIVNVKAAGVTLQSISVSPTGVSLAAGTSTPTPFKATGTFSDGTTQDLSGSVTWASSDPGVASIDNSAANRGVVTAQVAGVTNIVATFKPPSSAPVVSSSAKVTVTPALLTGISISPKSSSVAVMATLQFAASGTFSDGTTQILTADPRVTWTSSNPNVATFSTTARGKATGVSVGTTTVSATYTDPSNATLTDSTGLSVTPAAPTTP